MLCIFRQVCRLNWGKMQFRGFLNFIHYISTKLHCNVILHCTLPYCPVIHGDILDSTSLFYVDLNCIKIYFVDLHFITYALHNYPILHFIWLNSKVLHCLVSHDLQYFLLKLTSHNVLGMFIILKTFYSNIESQRVLLVTVVKSFVHSCIGMYNIVESCRVLYCPVQCFSVL